MKRIKCREIIAVTANYFDIDQKDLVGQCRKRHFARPRQVAIYLVRHLTKLSLPDIGLRFGGRDHTTALHAVRRITQLIETNEEVERAVDDLLLYFEVSAAPGRPLPRASDRRLPRPVKLIPACGLSQAEAVGLRSKMNGPLEPPGGLK